jgi:hypothetical protein
MGNRNLIQVSQVNKPDFSGYILDVVSPHTGSSGNTQPSGVEGQIQFKSGVYFQGSDLYYVSGNFGFGTTAPSEDFHLSGKNLLVNATGTFDKLLVGSVSVVTETALNASGSFLDAAINSLSGFVTSNYYQSGYINDTYYPRANPSGYVTSGQTGTFVTDGQISGIILSGQTGTFVTSGQTGDFITQGQTGSFVTSGQTGNFVVDDGTYVRTGQTGTFVTDGQIANFVNQSQTGVVLVGKDETGRFVTTGQSGQFQPSGSYVLTTQTGTYVTVGQTGSWLANHETGSLVFNHHTGSWLARHETGVLSLAFVAPSQTGLFVTTGETGAYSGSFVSRSQTGDFASTGYVESLYYPRSNPSGYGAGGGGGGIQDLSFNESTQTLSITSGTSASLGMFMSTGEADNRYAQVADTGNFVTLGQTGDFVGRGETGTYVTQGQTGNFVTLGQTGDFVGRGETGTYVTVGQTGSWVANHETGIYNTSFVNHGQTGSWVANHETGAYSGSFVSHSETGSYLSLFALNSKTGVFVTRGETGSHGGGGSSPWTDGTSYVSYAGGVSGENISGRNFNIVGEGTDGSTDLIRARDSALTERFVVNDAGRMTLTVPSGGQAGWNDESEGFPINLQVTKDAKDFAPYFYGQSTMHGVADLRMFQSGYAAYIRAGQTFHLGTSDGNVFTINKGSSDTNTASISVDAGYGTTNEGKFDLGGQTLLSTSGYRLYANRGLWANQHTSFEHQAIEFNGFANDQGVELHSKTWRRMLNINGSETVPSVVVNENGYDVDFRVEATGQANALFVQGSDGNVGIGTSSPAQTFHVVGNSLFKAASVEINENGGAPVVFTTSGSNNISCNLKTTASNRFIWDLTQNTSLGNYAFTTINSESANNIDGVNFGSGTKMVFNTPAGASSLFGTVSNTDLYIATNNTHRMKITKAGEVWVSGTLIADSGNFANRPHVGSDGVVLMSETGSFGGGGSSPWTEVGSSYVSYVGDVSGQSISGTGFFSPYADIESGKFDKLNILSDDNTYQFNLSGHASISSNIYLGNYGIISEAGGIFTINQSAYYPITFKTNNANRMRITAGGDVGIGTTSASAKLHVVGNITGHIVSGVGLSNFGKLELPSTGLSNFDGDLNINFGGVSHSKYDIDGNLTITGFQNIGNGRVHTVRISGDSSNRTITTDPLVHYLGTAPTGLSANKIMVLSYTCFGGGVEDIVGCAAAEA